MCVANPHGEISRPVILLVPLLSAWAAWSSGRGPQETKKMSRISKLFVCLKKEPTFCLYRKVQIMYLEWMHL